MTLAARLGQFTVVLILTALLVWRAARRLDRRRSLLDRFRRHQEP